MEDLSKVRPFIYVSIFISYIGKKTVDDYEHPVHYCEDYGVDAHCIIASLYKNFGNFLYEF